MDNLIKEDKFKTFQKIFAILKLYIGLCMLLDTYYLKHIYACKHLHI